MGMRAPSVRSIAVAAIFALAVFCFTLFVWSSFGGTTPLEPKGYRFHASFGPGGAQLAANADVRIAGVPVGKVATVKPEGLRTDAEIELQSRYAPIPKDTVAIVRQKTLLGETFVQLSLGSRAAPKLPEDGSLPISQIRDPQPVDDVLSVFDAQTRKALRGFFTDFATSLDGRGEDLNAALGNLDPTTESFRRLVEILDRRDGELRGLVRDTGVTLRAIGRRQTDVRQLIGAGDSVLSATAARDSELTATVRELPALLRELRLTLADADATAIEAAPVLRQLRPVAPLVRPALVEGQRLIPQVVPVASRLGPVIDAAKTGLPPTTRLLDAARPLLNVLYPAGRELVPIVDALRAYRNEAVGALAKTAAATFGRYGGGQGYVRVLFLLLNESIIGYEQALPTNRANPYIKPGGIAKLSSGGLDAFGCDNVDNPLLIPVIGPGGAPPCHEQGPYELHGLTQDFPALKRDRR